MGTNGTINLASVMFLVSKAHAGREVILDWDPEAIAIATTDGEVLAQYDWPAPGVRYVSTYAPRPHQPPRRKRTQEEPSSTPTLTEVLTHQPSPTS